MGSYTSALVNGPEISFKVVEFYSKVVSIPNWGFVVHIFLCHCDCSVSCR
jgi:hypothetical protein